MNSLAISGPSKIAKKFTIIVLTASLFIALAGSAITIYINYQYHLTAAQDRFQAFEHNEIPLLTSTLLIGDRAQLQTEMLSIISQPDIQYIKVSRVGKVDIELSDPGFTFSSTQANNKFTHQLPIISYSNYQEKILGKLTLVANTKPMVYQFYSQSISILIEQAIQMLLQAALILWFFNKLICSQLINIRNYMDKLELNNLEQKLILKRPKNNQFDEFDELATSINGMRKKLKATFQKTLVSEKEREALISSLKEKNEELERFTYTVSHDLKSPLVTINGFVGLLEKDINAEDSPQNKELIDQSLATIKTAARTMHSLLNDLLELSRVGIKKGVRTPLRFNELIKQSILASLAKQIKEKQAVIEIEDNMPLVNVEKIRFEEVFLNLIENALKYMEHQTKPHVFVGTQRTDAPDGTNTTTFYVKDNGRGLDPSYCEQVFDLFERVAVDVEGTGVGLAIVKRIIEVHNGRIWVESEGQGKGATFYFTIPTIEENKQATQG